MAKAIQALRVTKTINVGTFKVEVKEGLQTDVIKFDNGELKVKYSVEDTKASYLTPPIPKEHTKLVWQKAQQQQ